MALSMETRLKQKLTSNFIFFHWSAPNPSEKMMIMYLPTIWVFTWYDSMSRDCHMTTFSSKSSLLCRSWHVSNPAETRVKVLSSLFIVCGNREIMYFRINERINEGFDRCFTVSIQQLFSMWHRLVKIANFLRGNFQDQSICNRLISVAVVNT